MTQAISQERLAEVKRKIALLKRMSDGARAIRSYAEAETAASFMQKLLDEYNLTLESIDFGDGQPRQRDNFSHRQTRIRGLGRNLGPWLRLLRGTVCKYCYCISLSSEKDISSFEIVGSPENLSAAVWLIEYLSKAFVALSARRYREHLADWIFDGQTRISRQEFKQSYLQGCVAGLAENFEANWMRHEHEQPCTTSRSESPVQGTACHISSDSTSSSRPPTPRAIALRTESNLRDYLRGLKGKEIPKAKIDSSYESEAAYSLGLNDGRKISLNRQLAG